MEERKKKERKTWLVNLFGSIDVAGINKRGEDIVMLPDLLIANWLGPIQ